MTYTPFSYNYQSLTQPNEIRFLRLYPRNSRLTTDEGNFIPRRKLVHTTLDRDTEYAAISYAWAS